MPDRAPEGDAVVYTGYSGDGYGIYVVDGDPVQTLDRVAYQQRTAGEFDECKALKTAATDAGTPGVAFALAAGAGQQEQGQTDTPSVGEAPAVEEAQPGGEDLLSESLYSASYAPFQFYPRFVLWDGKARLGLLLASYELLEKQSFYVAGDYGSGGEYNGYIYFDVRNLYPTLWGDFYTTRERTTDRVLDDDRASPSFDHSFKFDVRYDLWAADFGIKLEFAETYSLLELLVSQIQDSVAEDHEYALRLKAAKARVLVKLGRTREAQELLVSISPQIAERYGPESYAATMVRDDLARIRDSE